MLIDGWKYYNHAAVPTTAPHETVDTAPIDNGSIWKIQGGTPILARWTSDWDCGNETKFWYVIKDNAYDISTLKSKRRYEINKGRKNFTVKRINPIEHGNEIYRVAEMAFSAYPERYRPTLDREKFIHEVTNEWYKYTVFGAFNKDGALCGYAYLIDHCDRCYSEFSVLKTNPDEEKNGINAALVDGILMSYNNKLQQNDGFYICDGARAIRHQTHFQEYLEKYFGFRKAYCVLHIKMKWWVNLACCLLNPFNERLSMSDNPSLYNIGSVITMKSYADE